MNEINACKFKVFAQLSKGELVLQLTFSHAYEYEFILTPPSQEIEFWNWGDYRNYKYRCSVVLVSNFFKIHVYIHPL